MVSLYHFRISGAQVITWCARDRKNTTISYRKEDFSNLAQVVTIIELSTLPKYLCKIIVKAQDTHITQRTIHCYAYNEYKLCSQ